ncbi:MAG TPA: hypothetical protein VLL52_10595 [Anaerolineae bacterium]|nr:hypothetical protein [Anaerolineae bacterium]
MSYQTIAHVGSDGSYDLLIEIITPQPDTPILIENMNPSQAETATEIVHQLTHNRPLPSATHGLRVRFFQRLPDEFVISARLDAAYELLQQL